jgi:DNA modification methylase
VICYNGDESEGITKEKYFDNRIRHNGSCIIALCIGTCPVGEGNIPTEKASQVGHPAPFPTEIPRRLIEISTVNSSIVFDPFCGSGTTACVCKELKRNFVTCDTSKQYCELAQRRLDNTGVFIDLFS